MDLSNENVIHIKKDGLEFLQFKRLLEYEDITHAYSLGVDKKFRTSRANTTKLKIEEYEEAVDNYRRLCNEIGSNYIHIVKAIQEHTDQVKVVEKKINEKEPDINMEEYKNTDGLITNKKNIVLSTTNADCILLLFYDPVKKVIANTHSGWRGTVKKIAVKTIEKMKKEFGCKPEDIICMICPSIRKCHFEVEKEVKELFEKEFNYLEKIEEIIEESIPNKKWKIDTVLINQELLKEAGLKSSNIIDSGICSVCHSNLIHSYRAEKEKYNLNTALIELK